MLWRVEYKEVGTEEVITRVLDGKELGWLSLDFAYEVINYTRIK